MTAPAKKARAGPLFTVSTERSGDPGGRRVKICGKHDVPSTGLLHTAPATAADCSGLTLEADIRDAVILACVASRLRHSVFGSVTVVERCWDLLLDLLQARSEKKKVTVTSACIAAGVPTSTALRWLQQLERLGVIVRSDHPTDRRSAFVALSNEMADKMISYFRLVARQQVTVMSRCAHPPVDD